MTFDSPGIVIIALMENLFPVTPSELIYPLAGKMAYDGHLSLPAIVLAGVIGSVMGSLILYTLGYVMGKERTRNFVTRHGAIHISRFSFTILSLHNYDRAVGAFDKYGGQIVLLARLMPFVHGVISIPAGVVRMNLLQFVLYTAVGSALWITPTVLVGYLLGSKWQTVLSVLEAYEYLWYLIIALVILYFAATRLWVLKHPKVQNTLDEETESAGQNLAV
jgi:membrane protein DedA with SNARE-associated domain